MSTQALFPPIHLQVLLLIRVGPADCLGLQGSCHCWRAEKQHTSLVSSACSQPDGTVPIPQCRCSGSLAATASPLQGRKQGEPIPPQSSPTPSSQSLPRVTSLGSRQDSPPPPRRPPPLSQLNPARTALCWFGSPVSCSLCPQATLLPGSPWSLLGAQVLQPHHS